MPDTWARRAGVVADETAAGTLQHYYIKSLINGYGYLPHRKPLSGWLVEDEATSDERDVAQSTLDPALLDEYEALIRDPLTGDDLLFRDDP
ncbi:uncharacterized protein BO66DRAFT_442782 [Aspergillus aculeatinus CBS 121060]|uniref:Uncharacterized protein n=1 Tax=Aspergillus aculeatinus CBS 121060 TaxID=1448322 RepID=A0ACD1GWM0_9EURO|nr:hypothetical protein BO66DRAFT_442782 [Aspergillus aculeatinus CBS 121060]RAH65666.1 hypothetical protein BO66DRAFT_442782 [Aspergillus aculeatinus CBS 121060]